jgi:hypothetical protein
VATVSAGDCLTKRRGETVVNGSVGHITWEQAETGDEAGFSPAYHFHRLDPTRTRGRVIDLPQRHVQVPAARPCRSAYDSFATFPLQVAILAT